MPEHLTLGVITARGGSKGIPEKNLVPFAGHPLAAHTVAAAKASRLLGEVIISTDSPSIAEAARRYGAEVPFARPAELALDDTPHLPVMRHAIQEMERLRDCRYEAVVILQPTSPLRRGIDIDAVIELLYATGADSVLSVRQVDSPHPAKFKKIVDGRLVPYFGQEVEGARRQDLPTAYVRNGCVYAVRRDVMMVQNRLYGDDQRPYVMDPRQGVDIDDPVDLQLAEALYRQLCDDPDFAPFDEPIQAT